MLRKLNPLLALAAGLIGGLASRYVTPFAVQAQAPLPQVQPPIQPQATAPVEIRAQSFTLVDGSGNVVGTFRPLLQAPRLRRGIPDPPAPAPGQGVVLVDPTGRELWRATSTMIRPVSQ